MIPFFVRIIKIISEFIAEGDSISLLSTLYSLLSTLYSLLSTLYSLLSTLYSLLSTL